MGAELALKAQVPLLILVGLSILALGVGALIRAASGTLVEVPVPGSVGFWPGFAVFFPAVTGVMAGLGLSGDLRDPGRSLPRGSLAAVLTGLAVYLVVPVLLNEGATQFELREDALVWTRIAILGPVLVLPGLWAAIFSSAVGSILGAPRTLQALARDGLAPRFLAPGGAGQPRTAAGAPGLAGDRAGGGLPGRPEHGGHRGDHVLPDGVRHGQSGGGLRDAQRRPVLAAATARALARQSGRRGWAVCR